MTIGVIDTGVEYTHKRLQNCRIKGVGICEKNNNIFDFQENYWDEKGHGTGIISIIHKHVPDASIIMVKLFSDENVISENLLCEGIQYLLDQEDVNMINISMGIHTDYPSQRLKELCERAKKNNICVISAAYYIPEKKCFPAHFSSVFSVGTGLAKNSNSFRYQKNNVTNILAKGGFQRVAHLNNGFRFGSGTSLATAHFTGILSKAIMDFNLKSIEEVTSWLEINSDNQIISITKHGSSIEKLSNLSGAEEGRLISNMIKNCKLSNEISQIAIYPYEEKEMKSLIYFEHLMSAKIKLAIGNARAIKKDEELIEKLVSKGIPITHSNLDNEEFKLFDTLVVGYFLDQLLDHNLFYGYELLRKCIELDKNLILWDANVYGLIQKIIEQKESEYSGRIYFPNINGKLVKSLYTLSPMQKLKTPIITVVGTGSKQGKFTTQLTVNKLLEEYGYNVSLITTEPQGVLFDADLVFPYGYNPAISVNTGEWSRILQTYMQCVERVNSPEIFLTASQGGMIPIHPVNPMIQDSGLKQLAYLQGIFPDAIIMTISPHDTVEFINRTLSTIQSFVNCDLLFYCLTPWTYDFSKKSNKPFRLDEISYEKKCVFFQQELKKPVINILDKRNSQMILDIIQRNFTNKGEYEFETID
ncbi:S8 family serine peptidase [Sinomicrobium oceani]|uniref:S8 family serine peptidase n=1 Tax=Sinomicrobium oceani TaxID=1150368 RepID=UPI00227B4663|nr:S8 family serine peptidase [Sinomicrobium oceani]